ncbi:hypothetical protein Q5P01_022427 [Channa striata]|uniref:Uncharacterized protein n=1 Tax=Channa striata TaxID=64152 RepID=A0AA88JCT5_CHASR|nr:hypothetical protein Q5P01_022427 [Channa striata]
MCSPPALTGRTDGRTGEVRTRSGRSSGCSQRCCTSAASLWNEEEEEEEEEEEGERRSAVLLEKLIGPPLSGMEIM